MLTEYERMKIEELESKLKKMTFYFWLLIVMRIISAIFFTLFIGTVYLTSVYKEVPNYYIYIFLFLGLICYILSGGKSRFRHDEINLSRLRKNIKSIKNDIGKINEFASKNDNI